MYIYMCVCVCVCLCVCGCVCLYIHIGYIAYVCMSISMHILYIPIFKTTFGGQMIYKKNEFVFHDEIIIID